MSWNFIQSVTTQAGSGSGSGIVLTIPGVTPGNTLIACVGRWTNTVLARVGVFPFDGVNTWQSAITSPDQCDTESADFQLLTFVATNVAAGDTSVTFVQTDKSGSYAIAILEYAGGGATLPIDQFNFASTIVSSGITSLSSGSIATSTNDLVFSCAFGMENPLTLTPSGGFTQRATVSGSVGDRITLTAWDQTSAGGSYSNSITASTDPRTMAVVIINLTLAPITRTIVQSASISAAEVTVSSLSIAYPLANTAGNLLIAAACLIERTDATITDTLGNDWIVVYSDPVGTNDTIVMAYCINCKAGSNTVTLNTSGGGTDDTIELIIAEYPAVQAFIAASKNYSATGVSSIDTGQIEGPGLLVSMFSSSGLLPDDLSCTSPVSQLATLRYQFSDGGFLAQTPTQMGIADQVTTVSGFYHNVFTLPTGTARMGAAILGFSFAPPPPSTPAVRCFNVPLSGTLNTLEVTRDLDADWKRETTFFITQSDPFPFTLRGLVFRLPYNPS